MKDKFGLSWQAVPSKLFKLLQDPDPAEAKRVVDAMLRMKKIDLPRLEQVGVVNRRASRGNKRACSSSFGVCGAFV